MTIDEARSLLRGVESDGRFTRGVLRGLRLPPERLADLDAIVTEAFELRRRSNALFGLALELQRNGARP